VSESQSHDDPTRRELPGVAVLTCDFKLTNLVALRHNVEDYARHNGLAERPLYRFVVAVNEITTNAVRHGGGRGHLRLWRTGSRLHCRITDQGTGLPTDHRPDRPPPHAVGGRGLWLAYQNAEELLVRTGSRGTTITLAVSTNPT
jgi:anti-sigma regulatory factor (Ser/Thr protein kinase)